MLKARSIVKEYGSTKALQGADLVFGPAVFTPDGRKRRGQKHVGQDPRRGTPRRHGTIALQGRTVKFDGVSEAIAAGIVPIYQQSSLFPNLTVLENLFAFETAASPGLG